MRYFPLIALCICLVLLGCNKQLTGKSVSNRIPSDSALAKEPFDTAKLVVADLKKLYDTLYVYQSANFNQYVGFRYFSKEDITFSYYTEDELCSVQGAGLFISLAKVHRSSGEADSTDIQLKNTFIEKNEPFDLTFKLSEDHKKMEVINKNSNKEDEDCILRSLQMHMAD